jgi:beta-galactosidase
VIAYRDGRKWAEDVMRTAGPAAKLLSAADRSTIGVDGRDLSFITVTVADARGILVPRSKNRLTFEVSGPGEIVAVDNGDATSHESFQSKERNAYNGLCLVIVRSIAGQPGKIRLTAKSSGLAASSVTIASERSR